MRFHLLPPLFPALPFPHLDNLLHIGLPDLLRSLLLPSSLYLFKSLSICLFFYISIHLSIYTSLFLTIHSFSPSLLQFVGSGGSERLKYPSLTAVSTLGTWELPRWRTAALPSFTPCPTPSFTINFSTCLSIYLSFFLHLSPSIYLHFSLFTISSFPYLFFRNISSVRRWYPPHLCN